MCDVDEIAALESRITNMRNDIRELLLGMSQHSSETHSFVEGYFNQFREARPNSELVDAMLAPGNR